MPTILCLIFLFSSKIFYQNEDFKITLSKTLIKKLKSPRQRNKDMQIGGAKGNSRCFLIASHKYPNSTPINPLKKKE